MEKLLAERRKFIDGFKNHEVRSADAWGNVMHPILMRPRVTMRERWRGEGEVEGQAEARGSMHRIQSFYR